VFDGQRFSRDRPNPAGTGEPHESDQQVGDHDKRQPHREPSFSPLRSFRKSAQQLGLLLKSPIRHTQDQIVFFNERHLRRVLSSYVDYYQRTRTHLSLHKDCPDPRPIMPRRMGKVIAIPKVGGLNHRYERLAA